MESPELNDALRAAEEGRIHEWVISFLKGSGKNLALAETLEEYKPYHYGPIKYPIRDMVNLLGPNDSFKYREDKAELESRVNEIAHDIQNGWQPPPLIATNIWETYLELADGGHRYWAFQKLDIKEYPTIFYFRNKASVDKFEQSL